MALLIPNRLTKDLRATPGEHKTFEALGQRLSDKWIAWFDVGVGSQEFYPDFVLMHARHGLLVLEVKDWSLASIERLEKSHFTTRTGRRLNPMVQARQYVHGIVNSLPSGARPPYAYGVVLPNITRTELDQSVNGVRLSDLLDPALVLTKEDLKKDSADGTGNRVSLEERLAAMFPAPAQHRTLSMHDVNVLRRTIDPSAVVPRRFVSDGGAQREPAVLSIQQERAAKSIGEGHRLMQGIAGSGKTLVMLYRAKMLARLHPDWNILFLCWNRTLIRYLEQTFHEIKMGGNAVGSEGRVEFLSYTQWAGRLAQHFNVRVNGRDLDGHEFALALTEPVLGRPPARRYQAILIDEGQDFHEDFYRLAVHHLDPDTDSLLICYDYAQNLYGRTVSWRQLGVHVQGKRPVRFDVTEDGLERNYRNTQEIIRFAMLLYDDRVPTKRSDDTVEFLSSLKGTRERGPLPQISINSDRESEAKAIVAFLKGRLQEGVAPDELLVLYARRRYATFDLRDDVLRVLSAAGIPYDWVTESSESKRDFRLGDGRVKVSTIHSAKGMDFEGVAVVAADLVEEEEAIDAILYVCATRARRHLLITTGQPSPIVERQLEFAFETTQSNLVK